VPEGQEGHALSARSLRAEIADRPPRLLPRVHGGFRGTANMVGKQLLPSHRVNFSVKHQGAGLPKTVSPTDDFQSGFPDTSLEEAIHETKPILQCRENDRISDGSLRLQGRFKKQAPSIARFLGDQDRVGEASKSI
jgi:hypothetical protein